jgi:hypothetical protein
LYTIEKEYFHGIFYFFTLDIMPRPNASMVLSGRDRNTPTARNYNSAVFSQTNQNIVQGQIYSVAVSEVNFPYDIPNVQLDRTDEFLLTNLDTADGLVVALVAGFYTGTEMATQLNAAIGIAAASVGTPANDVPTVVFDPTENLFSINPPAAPTAPQAWVMTSPYTFPAPGYPNAQPTNQLGKDLPSIMGFLPSQGVPFIGAPGVSGLYIVNNGYAGPSVLPPGVGPGDKLAAQSAPLVFTQYIDICSPQLCKFQYFRDGSTTNLARRSDVICRLYIANNVALAVGDVDGTRPFLINRQFQNPRVMRWTADNAIGQIDINLYDDVGQPLLTTWEPRPYQITFLAYELEKD